MRKFNSLFLAALLPAVLFIACSGSKNNSAPAQATETAAPSLAGKTIAINVPHRAGSSTDIIARGFQPFFSKALNANIIVENLEGGGGNRAHTATYRAKPDGLTLEISIFPSLMLGELAKDGEYKSMEYTYISKLTGGDYNNWFVSADSPFKSIQDVFDAAKTRRVTFAGTGIGTNSHAAFIMFIKETGLNIQYVSFDGGPEAAVAVMGHHVEIGAGNEIMCRQPAADGTMRVLMLLGPERQSIFPDAPTVKELGHESAIVEVYMGLIGPPGMDPALVKYIDEVTRSVCADPEYVAHIKALGSTVVYESSDVFKAQAERTYQQAAIVAPDIKAMASL
jgi:tripartite-type tricarboxylate transporter receptor subunit TctC